MAKHIDTKAKSMCGLRWPNELAKEINVDLPQIKQTLNCSPTDLQVRLGSPA